jgi:hypothetical protein
MIGDSMAEGGSSVGKVAEKLAGALEKIVDARILVLGVSLLLYLDIWLVYSNIDLGNATVEEGLGALRNLRIRTAVMFIVTYSMIMTITIPALRYVYCWTAIWFENGYTSKNPRSLEQRRLSDWATAALLFYLWDWVSGTRQADSRYHGLTTYLWDQLSSNHIPIIALRITMIFFLWFCFTVATERDW